MLVISILLLVENIYAQSSPAGSTQSIQQQMGAAQLPEEAKDVSDQELENFLTVNQKMQSVQIETQKKMHTVISEEGLSPKRYDEIARSQMDKSKNADASEEELQKAQKASNRMQTLQQQMHTKGAEVIQEEGLTPVRYQQIGMAIQQKPELQKRYQQLVAEEQKK